MAYRLKWEHAIGYAECPEGWVEQAQPERWWDAFMNYIDANGEQDSRELGTFLKKREAMDRVEQEFEQAPGPSCRVLMKDGQKVVEASVARKELPAGDASASRRFRSISMLRLAEGSSAEDDGY